MLLPSKASYNGWNVESRPILDEDMHARNNSEDRQPPCIARILLVVLACVLSCDDAIETSDSVMRDANKCKIIRHAHLMDILPPS